MQDFIVVTRRIQQYWAVALVVTVLIFIVAFTEGFTILLVIPILDGLGQETETLTEGNRIVRTINELFADVPEDQLLQRAALVFVGLTVLRVVVAMIALGLQSWLQYRLDRRLREAVYEQIIWSRLEHLTKRRDSDWAMMLNSETGRAAGVFFSIINLVTSIVSLGVYLVVLVSVSWQMTLIASGLLIGVFTLLSVLARLADRVGQYRFDAAKALQYGTLETLYAKRIILTMQQQAHQSSLYEGILHRYRRALVYMQVINESSRQAVEVLVMGVLALMIILGMAFLDVEQAAIIPVVSAFILILYRMLPHLTRINTIRTSINAEMATVRSMGQILRVKDDHFTPDGSQAFKGLQSGITFKNVIFQYPQRDTPALENICLEIERGQTVALVGSSGAGKSTLADLLTRLYDPQAGQILIDGVDLRELKLADWRRHIGVVSQDTFVFNETVAYNISYGAGEIPPAEIENAAQLANAHEFILEMPQGYQTLVGDRGVLLSGGQRQRIAIARAILRDPQFLILDEATSALDSENERLIQIALDRLSQNRTALVIAHRLSTITHADKIVVLENGRIIEEGTHSELVAEGRRYSDFYSLQFDVEELAMSELHKGSL